MPSQPPTPPLLAPYLSLPPSSLTILTSTLGASTNWLLLRFLSSLLTTQSPDDEAASHFPTNNNNIHIILISWLRDFAFWRDGAKRLGLDLAGPSSRVTYIDALTTTSLGLQQDGGGGIADVEKRLAAAAKTTGAAEVVMVLDGLDFLLAATEAGVEEVLDMVSALREDSRAMLITLSADAPLLHTRHTPLEIDHAALVMSLAHAARLVIGARELDTGGAKDVSGVLRIGRGGGQGADEVQPREVLYFTANDGSVRVFERGA